MASDTKRTKLTSFPQASSAIATTALTQSLARTHALQLNARRCDCSAGSRTMCRTTLSNRKRTTCFVLICTQWFVYRVVGLCVCSLVPTICGITCNPVQKVYKFPNPLTPTSQFAQTSDYFAYRLTDAFNNARDRVHYLETLSPHLEALHSSLPPPSPSTVTTTILPALGAAMRQMEGLSRAYARSGYLGILFTKVGCS